MYTLKYYGLMSSVDAITRKLRQSARARVTEAGRH
jgi:hypothetical protein